jgi:PAS domain S-box-containing protein
VFHLSDGRCRAANAEFETLAGRPLADLVGRSPAEIGLRSEAGNGSGSFPWAELGGEIAVLRPDGTVRRALGFSRIVSGPEGELAVLVLHDWTERLEQERALRESEARYRSLFSGVPVGLYRTNPEGRFLEVNPVLAEMLGYPDAESLRKVNVLDVYSAPQDRDRLRSLLDANGIARGYELMLRRKDGSTLWVELEARVVRDAQGRVVGYEGVVLDITERKLAEGMRRDLVAMLTHDIKTPLASIITFVEFLRDERTSPAERHMALSRIEASAREALALAKNLLDADRIERCGLPLQRQPTSLNSLVEDAVRSQSSLARVYGVALETRLEKGLPLLDVDPHLLDRVVVNLLGNALRFAPQGTAVTVETRLVERQVELRVRDRGPGIPEQKRRELFERFRPISTEQRDSTGLGLFIVRMITEAHGGTVDVECPADGGALFRVSLPLG